MNRIQIFNAQPINNTYWNYDGLCDTSNTCIFYIRDNFIKTVCDKYLAFSDKLYFSDNICNAVKIVALLNNKIISLNKIIMNTKYKLIVNNKYIYLSGSKLLLSDTNDITNCYDYDWTIKPVTYFINTVFPHTLSWGINAYITDINRCSYSLLNNQIIDSNGHHLTVIDDAVIFSGDATDINIVLEQDIISNNYRIKINNKYIRHYWSKLLLHEDDNTELFKQDSTWILIPNL